MGKLTIISINESVEELELFYRQTRNYKEKLRLKSLIFTKTNKFKTKAELSKYLGNWLENFI